MMGGEADGFERLWTPHRMAYVSHSSDRPEYQGEHECPLCQKIGGDDRESLVVHRGEHNYVVLNLYPYNPGHLMVCPYRHIGWYTDATDAERNEMGDLTQQAMRVLARVSGTKGFNIGMNQGAVGGAGISEHLHQHVVPRWTGDSNFLPIIAKTKALPELLDDTWQRLSDAWTKEG
ncbi:HIT family protein [Demequina oxidasica]|uniref:HIT family protein n=1 Tax=Demequina oxidasica TaxID=676199 RepID=UPI00078206C9|nr:HIT domain-containing protein [Demequina oxidasica]